MTKQQLKFNILLLGITTILSFPQNNVYAHVLKTSGSVGAVIHVTPEDDPIAGEQTDFFFEFKDKNGKFKPEICDCVISVLKSGEQVFSQPLFQNNANPSLSNASFSYTFPERNVYKVKVTGKPFQEGQFEAFNLEYDIRVERVSENLDIPVATTTPKSGFIDWFSSHIYQITGAMIILSLLIFALIKQQKTTKRKEV